MTKVNDGQITIKASTWPSFMYDVDEFEEGRVDKGLCRGYFLVRVSSIFASKCMSFKFFRYSGIFSRDHPRLLRKRPEHQNHRRRNCMALPKSLGVQLPMRLCKYVPPFEYDLSTYCRVRPVSCSAQSINGNAATVILTMRLFIRISSTCSSANRIIGGLGKRSRGGISKFTALFG